MEISVGATTSSISLASQVKRFTAKQVATAAMEADKSEKVTKQRRREMEAMAAFESLKSRCIGVICENFEARARAGTGLEDVPSILLPLVTARLPTGLDLSLTAPHIHDENYWKRCCLAREGCCNVHSGGCLCTTAFLVGYCHHHLVRVHHTVASHRILYASPPLSMQALGDKYQAGWITGTGTSERILRTICIPVIPRIFASGFMLIRWEIICNAMPLMSSGMT